MEKKGGGFMLRFVRLRMSRLQIAVDYDPAFILEAHRLGGRYKKRSQVWSFDREQYSEVAKWLNREYGAGLHINEPAD